MTHGSWRDDDIATTWTCAKADEYGRCARSSPCPILKHQVARAWATLVTQVYYTFRPIGRANSMSTRLSSFVVAATLIGVPSAAQELPPRYLLSDPDRLAVDGTPGSPLRGHRPRSENHS